MNATSRLSIGERLREERDRLNLNQEEMGNLGGVSKRTQAAWERGEQVPHAEYLALVAAGTVDVLYVVTGQRVAQAQALSQGVQVGPEELDLLENYRACGGTDQAAVRRHARALSALGE